MARLLCLKQRRADDFLSVRCFRRCAPGYAVVKTHRAVLPIASAQRSGDLCECAVFIGEHHAMTIHLKSKQDIEMMRRAGHLATEVLEVVKWPARRIISMSCLLFKCIVMA